MENQNKNNKTKNKLKLITWNKGPSFLGTK